MGKALRLFWNWSVCCPVLCSRHCTCAYTETGDPARWPGISQPWYWHNTVRQGSVRFNLTEETSPPYLFPSRCTYSLGYGNSFWLCHSFQCIRIYLHVDRAKKVKIVALVVMIYKMLIIHILYGSWEGSSLSYRGDTHSFQVQLFLRIRTISVEILSRL